MSDPTPPASLEQAFAAARRATAAAREGLDDLPEIARAEMQAGSTGDASRTTGPGTRAAAAEAASPTAPSKPDFAAFDDTVRKRVEELTQGLKELLVDTGPTAAPPEASEPTTTGETVHSALPPRAPQQESITATVDEQPLAGLKALREHMARQKALFEQARTAYSAVEMPDPAALLHPTRQSGASLQGALHSLAALGDVAAENDIEVLDTTITTLDQIIALAEDGRDAEARALFSALGDLGRQFWTRPTS